MPIFSLIDDIIFLKKSPFRIKSLKNIKLDLLFYGLNVLAKIYLGISLLFPNANIEGIKILDIKNINESDFNIKQNEKNFLILKIHNFLLLEQKKFKLRINDLIRQYDYIVLYFSEETAKNKYSKKIFFDLYKKHFLFYTEIPTKAVNFNINLHDDNFVIEDDKNNIILLNTDTKNDVLHFPYYSLLIERYKIIRYSFGNYLFFIFRGKDIVYGSLTNINFLHIFTKFMEEKHFKKFDNLYLFINDDYYLSELDNDWFFLDDLNHFKTISVISKYNRNLKKISFK